MSYFSFLKHSEINKNRLQMLLEMVYNIYHNFFSQYFTPFPFITKRHNFQLYLHLIVTCHAILVKMYYVTLLRTPSDPLVKNCHNFRNSLSPLMLEITCGGPFAIP